jgi:hypothetical protein
MQPGAYGHHETTVCWDINWTFICNCRCKRSHSHTAAVRILAQQPPVFPISPAYLLAPAAALQPSLQPEVKT